MENVPGVDNLYYQEDTGLVFRIDSFEVLGILKKKRNGKYLIRRLTAKEEKKYNDYYIYKYQPGEELVITNCKARIVSMDGFPLPEDTHLG